MTTFRTLDPNHDFPQIAEIINLISPEPTSAELLRERDLQRPSDSFLFREVALDSSNIIVGWNRAERYSTDPQGYYWVRVVVHPKAREQGVGGALFDHATTSFSDALKTIAIVRDNDTASQHFAEKRGFQIERHDFQSKLELATFDETPFAGVLEAVEATQIRLSSLAQEGDTEANRRKLYELNKITFMDIPGFEGEFDSFEDFSKYAFDTSGFDAQGQFLAIDGDEYVALGRLDFPKTARIAYNDFTGVHPKYRGQHLALAVKLLGIRFAKSKGIEFFHTHNDSTNAPMLHINRDKLGFVAEPGTYKMVLEV
jgi:GNAT superfamily N-acetyltransferase